MNITLELSIDEAVSVTAALNAIRQMTPTDAGAESDRALYSAVITRIDQAVRDCIERDPAGVLLGVKAAEVRRAAVKKGE